MKRMGALVAPLLLASCSTATLGTSSTSATTTTAPIYQLTLSGTIDGVPFAGVGVGSSSPKHTFSITSAIPVNYFTMQSCHRANQALDVIPPNPWYDWSSDSKSFSFVYNEAPSIETTGNCLLRFCAYSKTVGSPPVACAVVDFKSDSYQLPAENICNGTDGKATGTMVCQTMVGLIERVKFTAPVVTPNGDISGECGGKFLDAAQTLYEYRVPDHECSVIFMEKAPPHRRAKLSVFPYTTAIYPGAN